MTKKLLLALIASVAVVGAAGAQDKTDPGQGTSGTGGGAAPLGGGLPGTTCSASMGSNCSVMFPDNDPAGVASTITLEFCETVGDVNIGIDTTHSWVGDLIYTVQSPAGTSVTIVDQPGVPASTFGCQENDIFATFDDASATPVETECSVTPPAIGGVIQPENALSAFNGEDPNGTWTLTVSAATEWMAIAQCFAGPPEDPPAAGTRGPRH